ncbi:MAG: AAA family ATPase [Planctomycetia bacterium]|jgi:predicted ATPase
MKIRRLELINFRTFGHAVFENLREMVILVSPNGRGKSSILEAIAGAKDLVVPYHQDHYPFKRPWQQQHLSVWPEHLADPVKIGEQKAEIKLEVEATGIECEYLRSVGISQNVGNAHFFIEDGRYVTKQSITDTTKRLFQFHSLSDRIGFVDYIRPIRFYAKSEIGNFSQQMDDNHLRQTLSDFHRPTNQQQKYTNFKSYVVSTQLSDFSCLQTTGEKVDSLEEFRKVFNRFFAPKTFEGYRSYGTNGQIIVNSPFGDHDTDSLSDGEKEILHILAYLFQLRELHNIVLWDTPELHLNAALEARLINAVQRIAPNNQYWIATHSLELINSVPLESIYVLRQDGNSTVAEPASGEDRKTKIAIFRDMGAQVGIQLVSSVVAFVEGRDSSSDKRILDRLLAPCLPGVNFVAGGSCENLFATGTRANGLLEEACCNGDFLAIVDRDYRDDDKVQELIRKYKNRLFVWNVHELENIFLDPEILHQTLVFLGHLKDAATPESVRAELKEIAANLKDWIAADWVAWEFDKNFQLPSRRIGGSDPKSSLDKYIESLKGKIDQAADVANSNARYEEKRILIQELLNNEQWLEKLPGKQILYKYLEQFPRFQSEDYLNVATSLVRERDIRIPEFIRLQEELERISNTTRK